MKAVYSIVLATCVFVFSNKRMVAQEYYQVGVRSKSLAGISSCLSDGWSVFGNQAGLSKEDKPVFGISFSNYFLLKELSLKSVYAALPVDKNVFALSFYRYGYERYNENKIGLAFAKELIPGFSAGFQFNYFFINLPENEKLPGDFCLEGGIQYQFSSKLLMGMHCFNPFQAGIKTERYKYKLPCLFRFSLGTKITDDLWVYGELEKDLKQELESKFGIEYSILDNFQIRGGISGKSNLLAFGFAYRYKKVKADFSWQYSYRLGSTPSVAISYCVK